MSYGNPRDDYGCFEYTLFNALSYIEKVYILFMFHDV